MGGAGLVLCAALGAFDNPRGAAPGEATAPSATEERWYGDQLLYADAAAAALGISSLATGVRHGSTAGTSLGFAAGAIFLVVPPVLHGIHSTAERTLLSIALRIGLPLAGYAAGYFLVDKLNFTGEPTSSYDQETGGIVGLAIGAVAAALADDASARERAPATPATAPAAWSIAPIVSPSTRTNALSFAFRF